MNTMHAWRSTSDSMIQALELAIDQLRQQELVDGALWSGLQRMLDLDETELAAVLKASQGVEVISDELWSLIGRSHADRRSPSDDASFVRVTVDGQELLLSEDPWSPSAIAAMARPGLAPVRLALARPGQMCRLESSAMSGRSNVPKDGVKSGVAPANITVVDFVDHAISKAFEDGASDIHFESDRRGVGLKYRLDGVMAAGDRMDDPSRAEEVISRIKVLAQLDITERRRPQDGRIHWRSAGGASVDLRVSIMPSIFGEDAVLRLLDKAQLRNTAEDISLNSLGFGADTVHALRELAQRPHGMLLMTGPTGSGKTTTVYAALSEINDGLEKIITIEDPVEYELPGVLQIPVNEQKGLTFATGLRSILRHDPDKILVGEIRDAETAEIAVQSALTGHLVFTTVHANSLFDVLGRFQHFGIEPFALASALNGVVVQRLLRRLCPHCADWRDPTEEERQKLESLAVASPTRLPVAVGCAHCRETGYRGRFVVAEVHVLDDVVRDLIVRGTSVSELRKQVSHKVGGGLLQLALERVREGSTTLQEVTRVVGLA